MIDTNENLLERVRRADAHEAWREFYVAYREPVRRYARYHGVGESALDEVLQDTFVTLVRILPTFNYDRSKGRFRNFLLRIVHHRAQAVMKRSRIGAKRHPGIDGHDGIDRLLDPASDQWAQEEWEQARQRWRTALAAEALERVRRHPAMKPATLAIFEEFALHGAPAEDVARKYGTTVGNVHQIRHRTLARIQRELEQLLSAASDDA